MRICGLWCANVVEALGPDQGAGDRHSAVDGFARIGDDARLDQFDQTVAQHARMHAEIRAVAQQPQDGIRHRADPGLDDRAVARCRRRQWVAIASSVGADLALVTPPPADARPARR